MVVISKTYLLNRSLIFFQSACSIIKLYAVAAGLRPYWSGCETTQIKNIIAGKGKRITQNASHISHG